MESSGIGGFAPDWAIAPIRAQNYQLLDSPNERQSKIAQNAPSIPILKHPPMIEPAQGTVDYAVQVGRQARQTANQQIVANNQQHQQHVQSHFGRIHLVA
jgi:hypothetical protein